MGWLTLSAMLAVAPQGAVAQEGWTGFYAGGAVGRRQADATWTTTCLQIGFPGSDCPDASGNFADRFPFNNPAELSDKGWALSGFLGWQWQWNGLVLGVEGDFTRAPTRRTIPGIPGAEDPTLPLDASRDSVSVATEWDASVRARAGILVLPSLLAYGTGGPSWIKTSASAHCGAEFPAGWCSLGNVGLTETVSGIQRGWTWGGGLEWMMTSKLLLRAEYRVARYEALDHTYLDGLLGNADAFTASTKLDTRTIMLGVGYKF